MQDKYGFLHSDDSYMVIILIAVAEVILSSL